MHIGTKLGMPTQRSSPPLVGTQVPTTKASPMQVDIPNIQRRRTWMVKERDCQTKMIAHFMALPTSGANVIKTNMAKTFAFEGRTLQHTSHL